MASNPEVRKDPWSHRDAVAKAAPFCRPYRIMEAAMFFSIKCTGKIAPVAGVLEGEKNEHDPSMLEGRIKAL